MKSRVFNVVMSGVVGGASGFFTFRNEERKKYEKEMELKGYCLHEERVVSDRQTGTVTMGSPGWNQYLWKKGDEEQSYDRKHRPFKF